MPIDTGSELYFLLSESSFMSLLSLELTHFRFPQIGLNYNNSFPGSSASRQKMTGTFIALLSALIWTRNVKSSWHKLMYLNIDPHLGALFLEHCVTSREWRLTRGSELLGVNLEVLFPYPAFYLLSTVWQEIQFDHLLQAPMIDWLSLPGLW